MITKVGGNQTVMVLEGQVTLLMDELTNSSLLCSSTWALRWRSWKEVEEY